MWFFPQTPRQVQDYLAETMRERRRSRNHSRDKAEDISGVPMSTIRRFEQTGEISLRQFLMLVNSYGELKAAERLFPKVGPKTMDELLRAKR